MSELDQLTTEAVNPATREIDRVSILEALEMMNKEDASVSGAVRRELPHIARAVEAVVAALSAGGRLFYVGAGTSGRMGIIDAAECPPTFGVPREMVQGVMAGGDRAVISPAEGGEDSRENGTQALETRQAGPQDVVIGIAASGRTPFVLGAMEYARSVGAKTVSIANNRPSEMEALADIAIAPQTGPEAVTGSTRLKAGTAQKMALNMISTISMVRLGKTYGNLMVDVRATNEKLRRRALRLVMQATGVDEGPASRALSDSGGHVKTAVAALLLNIPPAEARERLEAAGGMVRKMVEG
ncbi:MAG: N-acetylmuramic acid 6-phosphate etherase [Armatimonadetes bacterium]|nr:N-acetylmuramic acid 6-phosphate etherase [Armatimonadota bacterium]